MPQFRGRLWTHAHLKGAKELVSVFFIVAKRSRVTEHRRYPGSRSLRPDENLFSDFEGASCVMRTQYFCSTDANGPYGISSGLVRHRHDVCWSTAPIIALPGTYGRPTKYTGSATTAPHSGHVCLSLMFHATGRTGEHRCRSLLRAARKYGPSPLEIVTRIALVRCTRTE